MSLSVDIKKKLGSFNLQVQFESGNDTLGILGASGCGKSMTLKCIAGIETPDEGRIVLNGRTLFDSEQHINLPPQKRKVGYLFQQYALFPNMSVEQNIACGLRTKEHKKEKIAEAIAMMHLEGLEKRKPQQLSGGQQQRVALARILVNEPDALLLDEPFSALDAHLRFALEQQVRHVIQRFGKTVLLVSHDRDEIFHAASNIAIFKDGHIEAIGSKESVFRDPKTPAGATLTGCKNISPIRVLDNNHIYAEDWGITLKTALPAEGFTHMGIRMHYMHLSDNPMEENHFVCQVADSIENPFSYTVMLRPENTSARRSLGIDLSKSEWDASVKSTLTVAIPPESILLLKE